MTDPTTRPGDGYDRAEWEGWRRDAGCDCTAPDPADCARYCTPSPRQTRECPCHYLSRRPTTPTDAAVRPLERPAPTPGPSATPEVLTGAQAGADGAVPRMTANTADDDQLDALYAERDDLAARVADYENRITWDTTCGEHARLLDACVTAEEQRDRARGTAVALENELAAAEARIAAVRQLHATWTEHCLHPQARWVLDELAAALNTEELR